MKNKVLNSFLDAMSSERNFSKNTLVSYASDLKKFEKFQLNNNVKIIESSRHHIEEFLKSEFDVGLSSATRTRRLSSITSYSHVVEQTPENVPFWLGKTYKPLFINWIPRVFWADKPKEKVGNEFGLRYGIISPSDGEMSINLPWITEMYINFGRWGVLVGMALVGFLLGGLERAFNRPETPLPETIVGITLLLPIFYQESNFSLMMGSFLPLAIFLYFYFRIGLKWRVKEKTT